MVILNGSGSHDTRDTTSASDQHRDKGFTGKTKLPEDTVHDKGNTRHVTTALKEGKEDKQDQDLRNESKYCADTGYDTIHDQAMQPSVRYTCCRKYILKQYRDTRDPYAIAICRIRSFTVPFLHNSDCLCEICTGRSLLALCECLFILYGISDTCVLRNGRSKLLQCCGSRICVKVI